MKDVLLQSGTGFRGGWLESFLYCGLCSAYLQGGINKLIDFPAAMAEMAAFSLQPSGVFAALTITLELVCSILIITGIFRGFAAVMLAGFTLMATLLALRFWELSPGPQQQVMANTFFEHIGLCCAFLLVAFKTFCKAKQTEG